MSLFLFEITFKKTSNTILSNTNITDGEIKRLCNNIKQTSLKLSLYDIESILINNKNQFRDMMEFMETSKDQKYRQLLDIINDMLKIKTGTNIWLSWIQRYITNIFLHFMQGITVFENRNSTINIGRPLYHRETSCGPKTNSKTFENNNLKCDSSLNNNEIDRRRRNIWTCSIERLVYDELYRYFIGFQNIGHLHNERRVIQELFESCFPISKFSILSVNLNIDQQFQVPISLKITYSTPSMIIKEIYNKKYIGPTYLLDINVNGEKNMIYDNLINATKEVNSISAGPGDQYYRQQSYKNEPIDWIPINPNGGSKNKKKWKPNCIVIDPWS